MAISVTAGIAALAVVLWLGASKAGQPEPAASDVSAPLPQVEATSGWPGDGATLSAPEPVFPADFGKRRIYIDAGHGADGNTGNRSSLGEDEQDFTLALAEELGEHLEQSDHFEVRLSRRRGELVPYQARVRSADQWRAHAFISLHSDVRGAARPWQPAPGVRSVRSRLAPGFSVLWSDEGEGAVGERRLALARATARALETLGVPAYDGSDYRGLYELDTQQAGVFVDRHEPGERIFVLRRPSMPSIIVETHNALDDREAKRWRKPETRDGFARAIALALIDALRRD
jgi:N-acetylmuramoyl-L-alanine amidase